MCVCVCLQQIRVNSHYMGIHGIPETIFKISALENDEKPKLWFSLNQRLFVIFLTHPYEYMFLSMFNIIDYLVMISLLLNKRHIFQDRCQSWPLIVATMIGQVTF